MLVTSRLGRQLGTTPPLITSTPDSRSSPVRLAMRDPATRCGGTADSRHRQLRPAAPEAEGAAGVFGLSMIASSPGRVVIGSSSPEANTTPTRTHQS